MVSKIMSKIIKQVLLTICASYSLFTNAAPGNETGQEEIINVGLVLYTKSQTPGTLNASWIYSTQYRGPGIAIGGPAEGYSGDYQVRYFREDGSHPEEYELHIEKVGSIYQVDWILDGRRLITGVGMETAEGLAVGWRRVAD
jgi:hypothetical protein